MQPLAALLEQPVAFAEDCVGPEAAKVVDALAPGGVAVLKNLRFHPGEEANDPAFADALAALGDLYVDDAFSAAHRAHASTEAVAHRLPAYAGLFMARELEALELALGSPARPVLGIVGGSKVLSKIDLLRNLVAGLDQLAIGGGMANTFLAAWGHDVANSLYEPDLLDTARESAEAARAAGCVLLLSMDVVCATSLDEGAGATVRGLDAVGQGEEIFDAGPQSVQRLRSAMAASATVVWNGPLGVFEVPPFDTATVAAGALCGRAVPRRQALGGGRLRTCGFQRQPRTICN